MQKINKVSLTALLKSYKHPSVAFYRAIELKQIFQGCNNLELIGPSVDIGSGDGLISSMLFDNKFTYGIDNGEAEDYLESINKKRYKKVLIESADKISLKNNSVNFVFSNSVIEHIPNLDGVISEVSRILKKDGYFIFTCPTDNFKKYLYINKNFEKFGLSFINRIYSTIRNKKLNHFNLMNRRDYGKLLRKNSLETIYYSYAVSSKSLNFWDKMARKIFIRNLVDKESEQKIKIANLSKIKKLYNAEKISRNKKANLLMICKKYK